MSDATATKEPCDAASDSDGKALLRAVETRDVDTARKLLRNDSSLVNDSTSGWTLLYKAAEHGDVEIIKLLLEHGASVDSKRSKLGETALFGAALGGSLETVTLLVDNGALVDEKSEMGDTPLFHAVKSGNEDVVRYLLLQGAEVDQKDKWNTSPLMRAAASCRKYIVNHLLRYGASPHVKNSRGETPLFEASRNNDYATAWLLLEYGASVSERNKFGKTLLIYAIECGQRDKIDVIALLCQHDASVVNEKDDKSGDTPLHIAARGGKSAIVRILISNGACIDEVNNKGDTPLLAASLDYDSPQGDLHATVKILVDNGASINVKRTLGSTALIGSIERIDTVRLLVIRGALVNEADDFGETPLFAAASYSSSEVVVFLLDNGADTTMKTDAGKTALHAAAVRGGADVGEIGKSLIRAGSLVNERDYKGRTPIFFAAKRNSIEMTKLLLESGASVDAASDAGKSPLFSAAEKGHIDMVTLLLDNGASVDATNDAGQTSLDIAVHEGRIELVQVLLSRGASVSQSSSAVGVDIESVVVVACRKGHMEIFRMLVEAGGSVNVRGKDGETPLSAVARWNYIDGVLMIITRGASLGGYHAQSGGEHPIFPSTIDAMSELYKATHSIDHIFSQVVNRLEDVCFQLQEREITNKQQSILLSFAGIIFRTFSFVLQCADQENPASWLEDRHALTNMLRDVHEEIDHFADLYNLQHGYSSSRVDSVEHHGMLTTTKGDTCTQEPLDGMRDHDSPFDLGADNNSPANDNQEGLLVANSPTVEGHSWFISPEEVDFEIWRNRDEEDNNEAFEGTWRSTRVTIHRRERTVVERVATRWYSLSHPHLLKLFGACHTASMPFLVSEHFIGTSTLTEFLTEEANWHLMWEKLYEAVLGLQYMHERGVDYGGLSCGNIIVGADGRAKLAGLDGAIQSSKWRIYKENDWSSDEIWGSESKSFARDIFAFGTCIVEAAANVAKLQHPKYYPGRTEAANAILSPTQWNLVKRMCKRDPAQRPSVVFVASLLKGFAAGNLSDADAGGTSSENQSQRLGDTYFPQLDTSIDEALELIMIKCETVPESHWLRDKVSPAVVYIYELIQERQLVENDKVVIQFCALLARIQGHLRIAKSDASAKRIARSQQAAEKHYVVFADLDRLLDILDVPRSDPIRSWWRSKEDIEHGVFQPGSELEVVTGQATVTKTVSLDYFDDPANQELWSTGLLPSGVPPSWYLALREVVFTESSCIGKGAFGKVYKGTWMDTPVVVKFMGYVEDTGNVSTKLLLHEIRVWSQLNHPNIAKFYGANHVDKRYFICEYAPHGDLLGYLKKHQLSTSSSQYEMWQRLYEVALGLQHMHKLNIVHNDLKCDNILIGVNGEAKIIDFGLSSLSGTAEIKVDLRKIGAVHWRSPEYLRGERPAISTDIYSLAMCILEVVTGEIPWGRNMQPAGVSFQMRKGNIPMRPDAVNDKQWNLIELMTKTNVSQRVRISFVVNKLQEITQEERRQSAP